MQRQLSLFELQPSFRREVEHGKKKKKFWFSSSQEPFLKVYL
jgi:hypothetical protein